MPRRANEENVNRQPAPPVTEIRPYKPSDEKELRLLLGMHAIEQLPVANQQAYRSPLFLSTWILISSVFVQYMEWWPRFDMGFLYWLSPLPGFASVLVPLLFIVDWIQRPYFEKQLRQTLSSEDILAPSAYYTSSNSSLSRFVVLEWKNRPIGYLALDATFPNEPLRNLEDEGLIEESVLAAEKEKMDAAATKEKEETNKEKEKDVKKKPKSKLLKASKVPKTLESLPKRVQPTTLPNHALIRHFHVDRVYHRAGVHYELVQTVLGDLFSSSLTSTPSPQTRSKTSVGASSPRQQQKQKIDLVRVRISSVEPEAEAIWKRLGFKVSSEGAVSVKGSKVILGETMKVYEITAERWRSLNPAQSL